MSTDALAPVTQTEVFAFEGGYQNTYDREIQSITVTDGKLLASADEDYILKNGSTVTFDNTPAVTVSVPAGSFAIGSITFADNAVLPNFQNRTAVPDELAGDAAIKEPRGDSGGSTGSFESRTVSELSKLAKERGIEVKGKKGKKPVKADFITALRG
jgi:hypothetical protein